MEAASLDDTIAALDRIRQDHARQVAALHEEVQQLRDQLLGEQQRRRLEGGVEKEEERPRKLLRAASAGGGTSSLLASTALQRLVLGTVSRSPDPSSVGNSEDADEDAKSIREGAAAEFDDERVVEQDSQYERIQQAKARFTLIAHAGDDREEISPLNREVTIPVLVKSYVEFQWRDRPKCALLMKKPGDEHSDLAFRAVANYLWQRHVRIVVETGFENDLPPSPDSSTVTTTSSSSPPPPPRNNVNSEEEDASSNAHASSRRLLHATHDQLHRFPIDFIVSLGGDGTFIRAAHAFPAACPPILAFAFGSLGFLTPFPASSLVDSLQHLLAGGFGLRLRARLEVEVRPKDAAASEVFQVLNECVIDRGISSSLVRLILYSNRDGSQPVTTVQGDGLIVATPTGSTAYSLSAGGSMVHPSVPSILITPICPHSLSFRPILVPDSATLRLQVDPDARNSAWLSIDGRKSLELKQGDMIVVRYSAFPVPAVMPKRTKTGDEDGWLQSLKTALHWNVIQPQKPLAAPVCAPGTLGVGL